MKKLCLFYLTFLAFGALIYCQDNKIEEILYSSNKNISIIKFVEDKYNIPIDSSILFIKKYFNPSRFDEFKVKSITKDDIGLVHTRYLQYHKGIRIESAEVIVHQKGNQIVLINGEVPSITELNTTPTISKVQAIQIVIDKLNAKKYAWQDLSAESWIRKSTKDENHSFYPNPELVIWNKPNENYSYLAYKVEINAIDPFEIKVFYIDANSGNILYVRDLGSGSNATGTAVTKYSGSVSINTETLSGGGYQLKDITRGNGIETKNAQRGTSIFTDQFFTDDDNVWDEYDNTYMDNAALDAHFAAEKTYDYFRNTFGRNSYDNNNSILRLHVHYGQNWCNARWFGGNINAMVFGDGDSVGFSPITSLDAVAHEFGHAITYSNVIMNDEGEPASINEGLSDIWGACVEVYTNISGNQPWFVGEDYQLQPDHAIDLHFPNNSHYHLDNNYSNPEEPYTDTYHGTNWYYGSSDNHGEHYNSTVLSHWFNLLSAGGANNNENGRHYAISGIGISKSADLVYNIYNFLTAGSDYSMICYFTLYISTQLFGSNSNEAIQTWNAWYAVGLLSVEVPVLISGGPNVCSSTNSTYSLPPELENATITWSTSSNINIVSGQGTRTVILARNENQNGGEGTITATYNHGNGNIISHKDVWVGLPGILTTYPVCDDPYNPYIIDLYDETYIMIWSSPGAGKSTGNWISEGVCYTESQGQFMYVYAAEEGGTVFWVTTSNDCGTSPEYFGGIQVGGRENKSGGNSLTAGSSLTFDISPNPGTSYLDIKLTDNKNDNLIDSYQVEFFDSYSRIIKSFKLSGPLNRINIQDLYAGYYFIRLKYGKTVLQKTLIVHK